MNVHGRVILTGEHVDRDGGVHLDDVLADLGELVVELNGIANPHPLAQIVGQAGEDAVPGAILDQPIDGDELVLGSGEYVVAPVVGHVSGTVEK